MNIAFIGIGGVGGYFGGKMAQLLNNKSYGINLYYIARGEHLEAIQEHGLKLKTSSDGEFNCIPTLATDNYNELPILDYCFICVKQYDLENSLLQLKNKISRTTQIIPLLNGMDIYSRIRKIIHKGVIFPACVYVGTHIESPGVVSQNGGSCTIFFGKDPENNEANSTKICEIMEKSKINFNWSDHNIEEIWSKFMFIASFGLVTAAENKTLGEVILDVNSSNTVLMIMQEIFQISKAEGITLPKDIIESSFRKAANFPSLTKTSFQRDYETPGKADERDLFGQAIINLGIKHSIKTLTTQFVFNKLENC